MNSWFDESGQEYGIDTHGMKLFSDESFECEIPMDSISKETLAELIGGVPIIRCKDCKYYFKSDEKCQLIDTRLHFYETDKRWTEEGFCAWAERKAE